MRQGPADADIRDFGLLPAEMNSWPTARNQWSERKDGP